MNGKQTLVLGLGLGILVLSAACGPESPAERSGTGGGSTAGKGGSAGRESSEEGSGSGGSNSSTAGASNAAAGSGNAVSGTCLSTTDSSGNLVLKPTTDTNYTFSSSVAVTETTVKSSSDFAVDWSGVKKDLLHHDVDLSKIGMVLLPVFNLSHEEMEKKLSNDELTSEYAADAAAYYPKNGETEAKLLDFVVPGSGAAIEEAEMLARFDPAKFDPTTHTYNLMISEGSEIGKNVRMVHSLKVDSGSDNQSVTVTTDSASISYDVDFSKMQPVFVPAGKADIKVDWISSIPTNAAGRTFAKGLISNVMVGKYSMSLDDIKTRFLDLEQIADKLYSADVTAGNSLVLTGIKDAEGNAFPGIDGSGTWILALRCILKCSNPAPWYLTVLKPCS